MSRRVQLGSDRVYHIYNRGVRKLEIFLDDSDYRRWDELLYWCKTYNYQYSLYMREVQEARRQGRNTKQIIERLEEVWKFETPLVAVIAYAHMPNHFHLVLKQLVENGISRFMHRLETAYAMYFNAKRETSGSLYQGTFKAERVRSDKDILQVTKYVHVNHLTAGLVTEEELLTYPWTSLPKYLRTVKEDRKGEIVQTKDLLELFNYDRKRLLEFTLTDFDEDILRDLRKMSIDKDFVS